MTGKVLEHNDRKVLETVVTMVIVVEMVGEMVIEIEMVMEMVI